jgi:hypothetical protein
MLLFEYQLHFCAVILYTIQSLILENVRSSSREIGVPQEFELGWQKKPSSLSAERFFICRQICGIKKMVVR